MINEAHFVRSVAVLVKKELMAYFNSPIAYVVAAVFLAVGNWLFFKPFFVLGEASLRAYFELLPWLLLFLAPAVTMRIWAEEKKTGTIELLLTLPITVGQLVLAKFIGAYLFCLFVLSTTISLPLTVLRLGRLDLGPVLGGYIGAALAVAVFLAVGMVVSSLTRNQIIAFVAAIAVCFMVLILGSAFVVAGLPAPVMHLFEYLGLANHYASLARGVVDTKDLIYLSSAAILGLWLNALSLKFRRW